MDTGTVARAEAGWFCVGLGTPVRTRAADWSSWSPILPTTAPPTADRPGAPETDTARPGPGEEDQLLWAVEQILKKADFPAFSEQIKETMALLEDEEVSARALGNVVVRNYGLTLKVLQVANAFANNRTGVPVFSVEHAIFRLGVGRVRAIAGGMVFFEHFRGLNEAVKELVLLSLVTANQAEAAAEKVGHRKPEEAYLCGMLRNVGEILIASYFPEQLQQIRAEITAQGVAITQACRSVLGFTYDELGVAMVGRWNMPAEVGAAMTSEAEGRASDAPLVVTLAQLAHALTGAIYRSPAAVESRTRVALVLQKFGAGLGISSEGLEKIAAKAATEARNTLTQCKISPRDLTILDESRAAQAFGKAAGSGTSTTSRAPNAATSPRTVAELEREIDDMVRENTGPAELQAVMLKILEAIQRGAGFDRALFALVSPERDCVQGRLAVGDGSDELKTKFTIPLGFAGGPIGIALARQQAVSLRADWELQPTEVIQLMQLGARMLCVLPLAANGQLIGCLYFDQIESVNAPTTAIEAVLHRLRDRTVQVLRRK